MMVHAWQEIQKQAAIADFEDRLEIARNNALKDLEEGKITFEQFAEMEVNDFYTYL